MDQNIVELLTDRINEYNGSITAVTVSITKLADQVEEEDFFDFLDILQGLVDGISSLTYLIDKRVGQMRSMAKVPEAKDGAHSNKELKKTKPQLRDSKTLLLSTEYGEA